MYLTLCFAVFLPLAVLASPKYSTWMLNSIISRSQGIGNSGAITGQIELGVFQSALRQAIASSPIHSRNATWEDYLEASLTSSIPGLLNATVDAKSEPLDRFSIGNALIWWESDYGGSESISGSEDALEALRQSIVLQNRTYQGGFWYYVYPNWSYLDGMFSLAPFYTHFYTSKPEVLSTPAATAAFDDVVHQFTLLWEHCYANTSGLVHHGYDANKTAVWADPITGSSPVVWGRSVGWYLTGLVETLDLMPRFHPGWKVLKGHFNELAKSVANAADKETGLWWQVVTDPNRAGNFLESSSSALFVYNILKGLRLGFLDDSSLREVAKKGYGSILDHFIVENSNGTLSYNGTVAVCSLNSTANYEYYVGRPIQFDSLIGSSAFVLASLEYENLRYTALVE